MGTAIDPVLNHEAFVAERKKFIGGSDVASCMDIGDYACKLRVFNEKTGVVPTGGAFFGNDATERGNWFEEIAAQWFEYKTQLTIRKVRTPKAHPDFSFMRPQPDYEIVGVDKDLKDAVGNVVNVQRGPGLLSVKVPGAMMFAKVRDEGLSMEYISQLQYELAIWNRQWGGFEFFSVINDKIRSLEFYVSADPVIGKAAMDAAQDMWRIVENGPAPEKKDPESKVCRRCPYNLDCHEADLLKMLEATKDGEIPFDATLGPFLKELKEREALLAEAEALVDEQKEAIKDAMGARTAVMTDGFKVTYLPKSKVTFQPKPFFAAHPELKDEQAKYENTSAWRELRKYPTKEKKGATP